MRSCSHCHSEKPEECFLRRKDGRWDSWCRACKAEHLREYRKRGGGGDRMAYWLQTRYGMTREERTAMVEAQGGGCAVCRVTLASLPTKSVHVDQDHATGRNRGILCGNCNRGLGMFQDSVASLLAAVAYLQGEGSV